MILFCCNFQIIDIILPGLPGLLDARMPEDLDCWWLLIAG